MRFAIVYSSFNEEVTSGLLKGSMKFFSEKNIPIRSEDVILAPGAFELPLIAKKLARTKKYQGVVCLGCVIKGDTAHFEFISLGATVGIMQSALETEIPISFGVLTTYTEEQATLRSRENAENKGREAANACFETALILGKISS